MPPAARIRAALAKPFLPVVFFFAGVTYDGLTLTRIDRLLDNLILLLYLTLLGVLIVLTGRADMGAVGKESSGAPHFASAIARARPYYPMAIQFLLGGLFSAYTIFYSQSASLTTTAVFFFVLVGFLVANEFLRDRLSSLRLLVSLYALVCFSFFTFFLPVLTGFMNTVVFLIGAILSAAVAMRVVELVYQGVPNRSRKEIMMTGLPAVALIGVLVGFYFLNWIPPVPLSMKFGGVYHRIAKVDGTYQLSFEKGAWYQFWKRSDDPFRGEEPAYCFTAVFAPVDLQTTIYHRWQYRPVAGRGARDFSTTDRIPFSIAGGREEGYRSYTVKQRLIPGDWRVDVETAEGRIIGRVSFRVVERVEPAPPELKTSAY
ncbi:MAG: DUF2914 domain-containing protein [Nitrospirae bacterium]|nr:DUF2914 domain-containing protein [Nitrospirota bacterium]